MRKNSPRKWLHACLDLLPVILIPVFMIFSHRHDVTENVQINYKYQSNEVNTITDLVEGNIYEMSYLDIYYVSSDYFELELLKCESVDNLQSFIEMDELVLYEYLNNDNNFILLTYNATDFYLSLSNLQGYADFYYDISVSTNMLKFNNITFKLRSGLQGFKEYLIQDEYDLPTYTDYNVIESVDIENTDVMDSFMNHFNNTIDRHFNMGNVFNLNGVYQWFNTNIFNGNAPQVIYSVWNIALYELVMDLLFLLYGLFMWFIDIVQHLMDKPFKSIK